MINYVNIGNRILNGLDDESHLLEKGRLTTNEVDWSHVPTKRKKPTKRKVLFICKYLFMYCLFNFNLGEKRTTTISSNSTTTATTTTTTTKYSIG